MMEKTMATHFSTLAWKIPWTEEPGRLQSMGLWRVGHDWATSLSLFTFHALEKEMATHSSALAWRIPGTAEPGGLPSMGSHRVRHDWSGSAEAAALLMMRKMLSVELISDAQSCPTLCDPMDCSAPGLPLHHQLPQLTQIHVHRVGDAIQPSHLLLYPSPTFSLSQHQGIFQ